MKTISQFIVNVCDLIEAEGKALLAVVRHEGRRMHRTTAHLAMGVAWLLVAIPLVIVGFCMMTAGLTLWIETYVGRAGALCITGALILAIGVAWFAGFRWLVRRQPL